VQPGQNHLDIFTGFTTIIEHSARIRSVLDFDQETVKIEVVNGNAQQVRLFALAAGVTTVTLVDENDQYFQIEVLVEADVRHLQSFLRRGFPDADVKAREVNGAVLLTGWVTQPSHITEIVEIAEQFYPTVLNRMQVGGAQQVQLRCDILEVQRSKIRRMGLNFQFNQPGEYLISTPGPVTPIAAFNPLGSPPATLSGFGASTLTFGFIRNNRIFQGFLQALREEGLLKIHATPAITALNGQPAQLVQGGESPVLVPGGLGTTTIEYKPFGVQLEAVAHILGEGRLRLQLKPEVSERDFSNAVTVDGVTVPAFTVRRASTEVEMNFGETLVIAGLISRREDASVVGVPGLGKLPWIGTAFSLKRYTEAETELVMLITPEYTAPLSQEQIPPGGPGKFTDTPTDHELFFKNLTEVPLFGDECAHCTTCQEHGACQQHPNGCPSCGNNQDCVKIQPSPSSGQRIARVRKPAEPAPKTAVPATPAGFSRNTSKSSVSPKPRETSSSDSEARGLIAP